MYPATCPNPTCRHTFTSDRSGSVDCPVCGTAVLIVLEGVATLSLPAGGPDGVATLPLPAARPDGGSTLDGPRASADTPVRPTDVLTSVGRFAVRARLGSGAFGDVFRAHDPQLDREVALKVTKPGTLDTPERVGRFLHEARAAAILRRPHIVPLLETGGDGDSQVHRDRIHLRAHVRSGQPGIQRDSPANVNTAAQLVWKRILPGTASRPTYSWTGTGSRCCWTSVWRPTTGTA